MINNSSKISLAKWAVLFMGCLFASCENSQKSLDEWRNAKESVEVAKNVQSLFSQGGELRSKLTAPVMIRYSRDTPYVEFPQTLRMVFFDESTVEQSRLDARYGKYFEQLGKAYLRDSVVVANVNGDTLWTPDLWWDQNSKKFYTDRQVRIFRKGDRIYGGKGLEASQDLTDIIIKQPTGIVIVPDSLSGMQ